MGRDVTVWYNREGDSLEVLFEQKEGHVRETGNDAVMEKVGQDGHAIGVSILNVRQNQSEFPVSVTLRDAAP
jgi:methylmalonyl-CoA mutase cobalamin-binding subunit